MSETGTVCIVLVSRKHEVDVFLLILIKGGHERSTCSDLSFSLLQNRHSADRLIFDLRPSSQELGYHLHLDLSENQDAFGSVLWLPLKKAIPTTWPGFARVISASNPAILSASLFPLIPECAITQSSGTLFTFTNHFNACLHLQTSLDLKTGWRGGGGGLVLHHTLFPKTNPGPVFLDLLLWFIDSKEKIEAIPARRKIDIDP